MVVQSSVDSHENLVWKEFANEWAQKSKGNDRNQHNIVLQIFALLFLNTKFFIIGEFLSQRKGKEQTDSKGAQIDDQVDKDNHSDSPQPTKSVVKEIFVIWPSDFASFNQFFCYDLLSLFVSVIFRFLIFIVLNWPIADLIRVFETEA